VTFASFGVTFAALEVWLRSRRGLLALWITGTAAVALVTIAMQWAGVPGWDDAAHAYKVLLLRDGSSVFWDNYWYGGGYGAVTYGFVFYWLAQYVSGAVIVVIAAGSLPVTFYLYQRGMWKTDDIWPAWAFAFVMAMYQANGQDPFVLALALTIGGLALLARGHPLWAAVPVSIGIFTNPMGFVVAAIFMATDFVARPETRRRYLVYAAAVAPAAVLRLLLGFAFTEPGSYLNETSQLMVFLAYALAGMAMAGVNAVHPRRPFFTLFFIYGLVCIASFVTPGSPLGNNIGRFFMVFGAPLLILLRHTRLRRPLPGLELGAVVILLFGVLQFSTVISHYLNESERPQTTRAYVAPALQVAAEVYEPDYRMHVVALRRHWEALYFPEAGFPITRGWYRQADAIHNSFFYSAYDGQEYVAWLRKMGVKYVFLPTEAPLDPWSEREARILRVSSAFDLVTRTCGWEVYAVRSPDPLLVAMGRTDPGGTDVVERVGHQSVTFSVDGPGTYLLKFTWSPYWVLEGGPGTLRRGPDRFLEIEVPRGGTYTVRIEVAPSRIVEVAGDKLGM